MTAPVQIVAAVLALVLIGTVAVLLRDRARSRRDLTLAHQQADELRLRLDVCEQSLDQLVQVSDEARGRAEASYLITDAGVDRPEPTVPDRLVLSAALGEPLVKALAFGHGVARALSPEARNKIWFEMRREVRRSRKQRRREMKDAWRATRTGRATGQGADAA